MIRDVTLVVGAGNGAYRECAFAQVPPENTWVICQSEPTWERPYVAGWTVVPRLGVAKLGSRIDFLLDVARAIHAERGVRGVVTFDEMLVVPVARIADDLGLPGLGAEAAERLRDKERTRTFLTAAGVPQPRFGYATSAAHAVELAAGIGYPVVVKPRGLGASIGVVKVASERDVAEAFDVTVGLTRTGRSEHAGGVLVEEYLTGDEVTIDGYLVDGRYEPMFVTRKELGPEPAFDETGHLCRADDPLLDDATLRDVLVRAHGALGVRTGVTHTELRLTPRGPVIIEVNGRTGGDLLPLLAEVGGGVQPARVAVQVARGEAPDPRRAATGAAMDRYVWRAASADPADVTLPSPADHPELLRATVLPVDDARPGLAERLAYVVTAAADAARCVAAMDRAMSDVRVREAVR